jgi:hypothetical protein
MALVVESTSSAKVSNSDSVTVTKPTGVAVGDLLLIAANGWALDLPACTGFDVAVSHTTTTGTDMSIALLYRIADASDVSASNYTVTLAGAQTSGIVGMLRVSGWSSGNPVYASASASGTGDPITSSGTTGLSVSRASQQLLLILNGFKSDSGALSSASFSGYSITSSDSNPSWTEVVDGTEGVAASSANLGFSCAYATSTDVSTITAYSTTVSSDVSGDADLICSLLVVINSPVNASGTSALHSADADFFAPTASAGTTGSNALLQADADFFDPSGTATEQIWANETKTSTSWTNESK